MKFYHLFPPYLPLLIFFPLIHPIHWSRYWVFQTRKGLYLALWEKGAKGTEVKSSWKKIKAKIMKPSDASPRDPQESNKRILNKKQRDP
jgi:hypothetical protein